MYNLQEIADKIKLIAKEKNISLSKLATDCGLNRNYISRLPNNKDINLGNITLIANVLGVSVDYLLGNTDNPDIPIDNDRDFIHYVADNGSSEAINKLREIVHTLYPEEFPKK